MAAPRVVLVPGTRSAVAVGFGAVASKLASGRWLASRDAAGLAALACAAIRAAGSCLAALGPLPAVAGTIAANAAITLNRILIYLKIEDL